MSHVHFDLDEVRRAVMELSARNRDLALSETEGETGRAYVLAQNAMATAMAEAIVENVRMMNDGRTPRFVGGVIGSYIGALIANVAGSSPDPQACLVAILNVAGKSLRNGLGHQSPDFSSAGAVSIVGERGGRA